MRPRRPFEPHPKDLATRCPRSGLRYFEQPEVTVNEVEVPVPCPGCGKLIRFHVTPWGVKLIPRHQVPAAVQP